MSRSSRANTAVVREDVPEPTLSRPNHHARVRREGSQWGRMLSIPHRLNYISKYGARFLLSNFEMMMKSILIPYKQYLQTQELKLLRVFVGPNLSTTIFVQHFFTNMENIRAQMQTSGFGAGSVGSGPDTDYGLGQCYGDLSLIDCILCHAGARTVVARCYPANGATVYLDGCFMRSENYSFFHEYSGPNDQAETAPLMFWRTVGGRLVVVLVGLVYRMLMHLYRAASLHPRAGPSTQSTKVSHLIHETVSFVQGILADGRVVAVKRLFFDNKHRAADLLNEVNITSSIEHKNLVRLLGCSCLGPETLFAWKHFQERRVEEIFEPNLIQHNYFEKKTQWDQNWTNF
ncbi:hypothetical protein ACS0TY_009083 [Phlomoides rotata]